jgi:hypothetical protein
MSKGGVVKSWFDAFYPGGVWCEECGVKHQRLAVRFDASMVDQDESVNVVCVRTGKVIGMFGFSLPVAKLN